MKEKKEKIDIKELRKNLKTTWKFAKNYKLQFFGYLIGMIMLTVISTITPLLSAQVVLKISRSLWGQLLSVAIIIFVVEISRNLFRAVVTTLGQLFTKSVLLDIKKALAREILTIETAEMDHTSTGIFIDRLNKDANEISNTWLSLNRAFTYLFGDIGILIAVFLINKILFLYYVIVLLLQFMIKTKQMALYFTRDKAARKLNEKNTSITSELIRGIRDIRVLNADNSFLKKMVSQLKEANEEMYNLVKTTRNFEIVSGTFGDLYNLLFIVLGIYLVQNNLLTSANFLIVFMYSNRITSLLYYLGMAMETIRDFALASSRVYEILDNNKFKTETFGHRHLPKAQGNFAFNNVDFGYDKNYLILKNMSFQIKANETVAFVGGSGGGKTTIFSLLDKLYPVTSGEITIDGININELDKDSIRNNMSIITQSPYIFNFSIKENIKIVKEDATDEEVINVCKIACLHDYIMSLPEGYDTIVGEGGLVLSGGQRQRLAIARALIKHTEIILFDEATSALDNKTQKEIQNAINNMKGEYTILIIAHRLSTVINSNRILLVNDGRIEAEGTHDQLMASSSVYRKLYSSEIN